ncbi:MAG: hypothetical protein ACTS3F_02465 [Phycisphaerales bacterium]
MLIPVQTRKKMIAAVERGESIYSVARRFEVTPQGLGKMIRTTRERGSIEPIKPGPKRPVKLTPADDATMLALIEADTGITLNAIRAKLSVEVAESTVCRRLQKLRISLKKSR